MALVRTNMNVAGPNAGIGPKLWTYVSSDALTDIDDSGYFDDVTQIASGDLLWAYSTNSSTGRLYRFTNTAGVITTTGLFAAA